MAFDNSQAAKVSIIIAVYNIEKYIGKCLQSIIEQDYRNIEIIAVDDCSQDASGKICDEYAEKDSRIKVIHHTRNTRQSGVRNDGLDAATGDYIVFVDGDDWLAKDFTSYMLNVITETESDMAINLVNFTTRDTKQVPPTKIQIWSPEKATAEMLFPHITIGAWNKIYKREFIENNKLRFQEDLYIAEGDRFIFDAAQRANQVAVGYRKVYYYRLNNVNSATTKYDIRQSEGAIFALTEMKKDLILSSPYILSAIDQHMWINHFWNLRQIIALKKTKEKKSEYTSSKAYVKRNVFSVVRSEPCMKKKVKFFLTGMFPCFAARVKNLMFDIKLKKDVARYKKMEERGEA